MHDKGLELCICLFGDACNSHRMEKKYQRAHIIDVQTENQVIVYGIVSDL